MRIAWSACAAWPSASVSARRRRVAARAVRVSRTRAPWSPTSARLPDSSHSSGTPIRCAEVAEAAPRAVPGQARGGEGVADEAERPAVGQRRGLRQRLRCAAAAGQAHRDQVEVAAQRAPELARAGARPRGAAPASGSQKPAGGEQRGRRPAARAPGSRSPAGARASARSGKRAEAGDRGEDLASDEESRSDRPVMARSRARRSGRIAAGATRPRQERQPVDRGGDRAGPAGPSRIGPLARDRGAGRSGAGGVEATDRREQAGPLRHEQERAARPRRRRARRRRRWRRSSDGSVRRARASRASSRSGVADGVERAEPGERGGEDADNGRTRTTCPVRVS